MSTVTRGRSLTAVMVRSRREALEDPPRGLRLPSLAGRRADRVRRGPDARPGGAGPRRGLLLPRPPLPGAARRPAAPLAAGRGADARDPQLVAHVRGRQRHADARGGPRPPPL